MAQNAQSVVLPGQPLGASAKHVAGRGTHLYNGQICASIAGYLHTTHAEPTTTTNGTTKPTPQPSTAPALPTLSIQHSPAPSTAQPSVSSTVLARVQRISPRLASVAILTVDDAPCAEPLPGIIRQQDIRATEKDRVKVADSFRPGDVVRAEVVSLGDMAGYYLSTARNELGVVMAKGRGGGEMVPVSWCEMMEVGSGVREARKVAKTF